MRISSNTTMY